MRDLIDARPLRIRSVLSEARDAAVNDARIDRRHRLVVDAEPVLHVGAVVLDHHIGGPGEIEEERLALFALEVERHVQLVAMQVLVIGAEPIGAGRLAFRAARDFDLDHFRAPVGELPCAGRTRAMQGQVKDCEVLKRQLCHWRVSCSAQFLK